MVVLETIKLAVELAKAGVELGKEIYKLAKEVHKDVSKARAIRLGKEQDSRAAKEYAAARAKLNPVSPANRPTAATGAASAVDHSDTDAHWPPQEVLQGTMVLKTLGITMSGTFVDGELEGQGAFQNASASYVGEFVGGHFQGIGKVRYLKSGATYVFGFDVFGNTYT